MIRTLFVALIIIFLLPISFIFLIPDYLLRIAGLKKAAWIYMSWLTQAIARGTLMISGIKVVVSGLENLPKDRKDICLISNHQSNFDSFAIRGYVPINAGFVAKKELFRIPFFNLWLYSMRCIKIVRHNLSSASRAIEKGIRSIRNGFPVLVYPEGTRSKTGRIGKFKGGALKLATRSGAVIVPITVDGGINCLEEKGRVTPGTIYLTVHKAIETASLSAEEKKALPDRLRAVINSAMRTDG